MPITPTQVKYLHQLGDGYDDSVHMGRRDLEQNMRGKTSYMQTSKLDSFTLMYKVDQLAISVHFVILDQRWFPQCSDT